MKKLENAINSLKNGRMDLPKEIKDQEFLLGVMFKVYQGFFKKDSFREIDIHIDLLIATKEYCQNEINKEIKRLGLKFADAKRVEPFDDFVRYINQHPEYLKKKNQNAKKGFKYQAGAALHSKNEIVSLLSSTMKDEDALGLWSRTRMEGEVLKEINDDLLRSMVSLEKTIKENPDMSKMHNRTLALTKIKQHTVSKHPDFPKQEVSNG